MSENAILLTFGIFCIMAFFGLAAFLCLICEKFFPKLFDRLEKWLNIPNDEWEET